MPVDSSTIAPVANCMDWAKDNFKTRRRLQAKGVLCDKIIKFKDSKTKSDYPIYMHRAVAEVQVDGKLAKMALLVYLDS